MKLLEQLYRWRNVFCRQGAEPTFIPLTAEELSVVVSDCHLQGSQAIFKGSHVPCADAVTGSKLYGCDVFESPFAQTMRQRQIDMPVTQLQESADIPMRLYESEGDCYHDNVLRRRLIAHICSDTTSLKLTFEWDSLAAFKRKFRLTKWFPVKTRTVTIEGRILYPYLKISLPHNKHHVSFKHVS